MNTWEFARLDVGGGIELRRSGERYQFRPARVERPANLLEVQANAEVRSSGGAWMPVPPRLMPEARAAFGGDRS